MIFIADIFLLKPFCRAAGSFTSGFSSLFFRRAAVDTFPFLNAWILETPEIRIGRPLKTSCTVDRIAGGALRAESASVATFLIAYSF